MLVYFTITTRIGPPQIRMNTSNPQESKRTITMTHQKYKSNLNLSRTNNNKMWKIIALTLRVYPDLPAITELELILITLFLIHRIFAALSYL